ncbi:MAG: hypothetical protein AAF532_16965 [Planctomycetota bacterium]
MLTTVSADAHEKGPRRTDASYPAPSELRLYEEAAPGAATHLLEAVEREISERHRSERLRRWQQAVVASTVILSLAAAGSAIAIVPVTVNASDAAKTLGLVCGAAVAVTGATLGIKAWSVRHEQA